MGSPLGSTFADFYMSDLGNKLLSEPVECNLLHYRRYVDDALTIFEEKTSVNSFENKFASTRVLDFIHDEAQNEQFQFLY